LLGLIFFLIFSQILSLSSAIMFEGRLAYLSFFSYNIVWLLAVSSVTLGFLSLCLIVMLFGHFFENFLPLIGLIVLAFLLS